MFPEGTRTRPGEPLAFHRGAASVAIQSAVVLTPVFITSDPVFLPKYQPWYRVPRTRPHVCLRVGDDIDLADYRNLPPPKASRLLNESLRLHYSRVLDAGACYNVARKTQGPHATRTIVGPRIANTDRGEKPS
jgi:1-acyl-sn-glycerol-3-phosphate acyltransferase